MGKSRTITLKINDLPLQVTIDADDEEVYRRAERRLNQLYNSLADRLTKPSREQVLAFIAYDLMLKKVKQQDELLSIEKAIDQSLAKEHKD